MCVCVCSSKIVSERPFSFLFFSSSFCRATSACGTNKKAAARPSLVFCLATQKKKRKKCARVRRVIRSLFLRSSGFPFADDDVPLYAVVSTFSQFEYRVLPSFPSRRGCNGRPPAANEIKTRSTRAGGVGGWINRGESGPADEKKQKTKHGRNRYTATAHAIGRRTRP